MAIYGLLALACQTRKEAERQITHEVSSKLPAKSTRVVASLEKHIILEENLGMGSNYYYSCEGCPKTFLFLTCAIDCNEKVGKISWAPDSASVALLISGSTRLESGSRLLLYQLDKQRVVERFDGVSERIVDFTLTADTLVYFTDSHIRKAVAVR